MRATSERVRDVAGIRADAVPDEILRSTVPVVLRGLAADWPAVQAGLRSPCEGIGYLRRHDRGASVVAMAGAPAIQGRFFYNDDLTGFNFHLERPKLAAMLDSLERYLDGGAPPALYVGSTTLDECLPGLGDANRIDLGGRDALTSIWIGNRARIAAHQDVPDNLACVVAGRRRFTLFAPQELPNLYIGPLDFTPAGQAISLVDFASPDLDKHPRFADAMTRAQVAELEPGDAIFIPSLWWHHVESLEPFNVLINYWWRQSPAYMDSPINALMLAIMSVRDLPAEQRSAWQQAFEHYVFNAGAETAAHIPEHARRVLAPLDAGLSRELRARLLKRLNR